MDNVLIGLDGFAAAYLDDLIIFSKTWDEHLTHLEKVLERLGQSGLTAKLKKCQFGTNNCHYLGHIVGEGCVRPEDSKIKAIKEFPLPTTKKQVRTFLGLTGYYRRFIPNYATIAAPLTDLTRKVAPNTVHCSQDAESSFNALKEFLCAAPILKSPECTFLHVHHAVSYIRLPPPRQNLVS